MNVAAARFALDINMSTGNILLYVTNGKLRIMIMISRKDLRRPLIHCDI